MVRFAVVTPQVNFLPGERVELLVAWWETWRPVRLPTATHAVTSWPDHAAYQIGGLVGFSLEGQITHCSASGNISGGEEARGIGGLIGEVHFWTEVSDCYAVAQVTTGRESGGIGGLVGIASEGDLFPSNGKIAQCFAAGVVDPGEESSDVGGLLGIETRVQPLTHNCYFLVRPDSTGMSNAYGSGLTAEQMRQQSNFVGWDFDTVWIIRPGQDYPHLRWEEP